MSQRILLIQGHPDPAPQRLCRALGYAYADAANDAGHVVTQVDVARLDFPLLRTQHAFEHDPVPAILLPAQEALLEADHLVLIFPLWLGGAPALLRGFLEQVARPNVVFAARDRGFPVGLLKGKTARVIVTMGMPALAYRWWYGAYSLRGLERSVLRFAGIGPVRHTLFGGVATASPARRQRWFADVRELARGAT